MRHTPRTRLQASTAAIVIAAALIGALPGTAAAATGFGDVGDDTFYTGAVAWMVDQGITTGIETGCFGPDENLTRGQIATFLFRLDASQGNDPSPTHHPFDDIVSPYQEDPIGWLYAAGVTNGTSPALFSPSAAISRGDFAVMLWRYAGRPEPTATHAFTDVSSAYQDRAISWLAETGITTGTSPTTFHPADAVSRAQAATFMHRFMGEPETERIVTSAFCPREMRAALMVTGLQADEARCAAPYLADWTVEHLIAVAAHEIDASQDWDLIVAVSLIGHLCLTDDRVADLSRLFL